MARKKLVALSVGVLVAGASGAMLMDGATRLPLAGAANLASLLSDRSPGERKQGALSSKARAKMMPAAAQPAQKPRSKVLAAAALPAAVPPPVAALAPVGVPGALPVPLAALPVSAAAAPAGSGFFLPPIPIIPGGGGGGTTTLVVPPGGTTPPPGGGATPPPPGPAVPEPGTWLMLISGFGILGFALRRRRLINSPVVGHGRSRSAVA